MKSYNALDNKTRRKLGMHLRHRRPTETVKDWLRDFLRDPLLSAEVLRGELGTLDERILLAVQLVLHYAKRAVLSYLVCIKGEASDHSIGLIGNQLGEIFRLALPSRTSISYGPIDRNIALACKQAVEQALEEYKNDWEDIFGSGSPHLPYLFKLLGEV